MSTELSTKLNPIDKVRVRLLNFELASVMDQLIRLHKMPNLDMFTINTTQEHYKKLDKEIHILIKDLDVICEVL